MSENQGAYLIVSNITGNHFDYFNRICSLNWFLSIKLHAGRQSWLLKLNLVLELD